MRRARCPKGRIDRRFGPVDLRIGTFEDGIVKLGVLSDIHANAFALAAVLTAARAREVDALLIAGDFVGYYYWPAQTLELLTHWQHWSIRGNHDRMLEEAEADPDLLARCVAKYGSGLEVALLELSPHQKAWLKALPDKRRVAFDNCEFLMAHGTPWDADEYLYPDAPEAKWAALADEKVDFVLLGHTHYRLARPYGNCWIVNPGSVGQQRDSQPGAAWALIDTTTRVPQLLCEPYDVSAVSLEVSRRDPQLPYLRDVLYRS